MRMKKESKFQNFLNSFLIFLALFFFLGALFNLLFFEKQKEIISLKELAEKINQGEVKSIKVKGDIELEVLLKDGEKLFSQKDPNESLREALVSAGAKPEKFYQIKEITFLEENQGWLFLLGWVLPTILPLILLLWFFWSIFKKGEKGTFQTFSFGKAKPRLFGPGGEKIKEKVTFNDVADLEEAKEELKEVVDFLKNPQKFLKMGARIPRGVLLVGPPGCGKTLLAKAVATEAGVPFFSIAGSEFMELFVGVGASRVRDLFFQARKYQPCVVFIDELDAIGGWRGISFGGGESERQQTLNQILVEMDGLEKEAKIVVLAATNRPDILDPALLRPGRFDRRIVLDLPDLKGREEILKVHARGKPLGKDVNLREIAERTPGFSGADLANIMNEAAILAARKGKKEINQDDLREAIEKVLLGPQRKSHLLSKKEKEIAAFHEAGHAVVASFLEKAEPVQKVSIVSRGMAAGYTLKLPTEEKHFRTKSEFEAEIATLLGGYVAEKLKFGEITTGASSDLQKATELAKKLVMEYGMSRLGPLTFGKKESFVFLGKEATERDFSEKVAEEIDKEIKYLIKQNEKKAKEILKKHFPLVEKIAKILLEKETIERKEFEKIIKEYKNALQSKN